MESMKVAHRNIENEILKYLDLTRSDVFYRLDEYFSNADRFIERDARVVYKINKHKDGLRIYIVALAHKELQVFYLTVKEDGRCFRFNLDDDLIEHFYAVNEFAKAMRRKVK